MQADLSDWLARFCITDARKLIIDEILPNGAAGFTARPPQSLLGLPHEELGAVNKLSTKQ